MRYIKLFEDFSKNEGLFDFLNKKEKPGFGLDTDKSQQNELKEKTLSQINISYETSWDASFIIDITGDFFIESEGNYIITPKKIKVTPTYNFGYGAKYKPIDFHNNYYEGKRGTDNYVNSGNAGSFKEVDELYSNLNTNIQKYLGNDIKLSFYKVDLESWSEEHEDANFIIGKKTPTWVKDNLKLPFIEDGELPETNFIIGDNKLKEAIWVSIPEMGYAMANPGNGFLRKISVFSTEMW